MARCIDIAKAIILWIFFGPFLEWDVDKTGNEGYYKRIYIVKIFD